MNYRWGLMRVSQITIVLATVGLLFPIRAANAISIVGALDCSGGAICTISGIGGPLFTGNASTGDVLDITFAGGAFFQPILDDQSQHPWEVTMVGEGTNSGDDFAVGMHLSDNSGDSATGSAGLSLNNLLSGVGGDGVSFVSLPIFVYDLHIEIRNDALTDAPGTANFTLDLFRITDKADEGPVITFEQGPSAVPLPAALPLYGTGLGLFGLFGWWRRRRVMAA